jgi:hypothetical protein
MLIYTVKFPNNFTPRVIAFKTYEQAASHFKIFKLSIKKDMKIICLVEDEYRTCFIDPAKEEN